MIKSINKINVAKVSKQHYKIEINGEIIGILERSELRYLIEKLDSAIEVDQTKQVQEFPLLTIPSGPTNSIREADADGEYCAMCIS